MRTNRIINMYKHVYRASITLRLCIHVFNRRLTGISWQRFGAKSRTNNSNKMKWAFIHTKNNWIVTKCLTKNPKDFNGETQEITVWPMNHKGIKIKASNTTNQIHWLRTQSEHKTLRDWQQQTKWSSLHKDMEKLKSLNISMHDSGHSLRFCENLFSYDWVCWH